MPDTPLTTFVLTRLPELGQRVSEHLILTGFSTGIATLIGVPIGIIAFYNIKLRGWLLGGIGILQTIPSLAMLAILLALFQKIGWLPSMVALILYALLPIVRNTLTGLLGVDKEIIEAAQGLGMTKGQQIIKIRIPLSLPVIMAGVRTAAVVAVGIVTLSAFIGAGGLGEFINRGLALSNTRLICLGAIPAALLALFLDFILGTVEKVIHPKFKKGNQPRKSKSHRFVKVGIPIIILSALFWFFYPNFLNPSKTNHKNQNSGVIRIASKNFTEQLILGELMAQAIESQTHLAVDRKFNLGGTLICHEALKRGEIDLYAEYTGTGLMAILNFSLIADPKEVYRRVSKEYLEKFDLIWLEPFGFNNTYTITVRKEDAIMNNWKTISDLTPIASALVAGFSPEFQERSDGYRRLQKIYGFNFGEVKDLDPSLTYRAIFNKEVDVIDGYATDGRIPTYDLIILKDNKGFFPPYYAAPVIRQDILRIYPELFGALASLAHLIDDDAMRNLNFEVDKNKREVKEVTMEFLQTRNLLKSS